jgi:chloramphenicol-sensitive protein RarD
MNIGALLAFTAYFIWGLFPLYFMALHTVAATEILSFRIAGSFIFMLTVLIVTKDWRWIKEISHKPKLLLLFAASSIILTINWLTYTWGVIAGHVVETSLGYFINPLVSVFLGVFILHEKLRIGQWIPIGITVLAVGYLTFSVGQLPWIALVLAFSFGFYGLLKKISPLNALRGLTLETTYMLLPALIYLFFLQINGSAGFLHQTPQINVLLLLLSVVTAVPLLAFSAGAQRIPLTLLGLLQYVSPTLQFILGVFVFKEPFEMNRLIGFTFIWLALILYSAESINHAHRKFESRLVPGGLS